MAHSATPNQVARTCLCLHVQRAARVLGRRYDQALRPLNLTIGQFSILMFLTRPRPIGISELAENLGMDRTTLTAALKPLVRRGLLLLEPHPGDLRARHIELTGAGRTLSSEALSRWESAQAELIEAVPDTDFDRLRADLVRLT